MTIEGNIIKVFTGTQMMVNMLKGELRNKGITSLIKNNFNSGIIAGFSGGTPSSIELYVETKNEENARKIIDEILKNEGL